MKIRRSPSRPLNIFGDGQALKTHRCPKTVRGRTEKRFYHQQACGDSMNFRDPDIEDTCYARILSSLDRQLGLASGHRLVWPARFAPSIRRTGQ
jgi:hypothetical protein